MATINQLVRKSCKRMVGRSDTPALQNCPRRRGVYTRAYTTTPKKPDPTLRKVRRIRLINGFEVSPYTGGGGHNLQEHNVVLIHGDCVEDLPGVRYHTVCGSLNASGVKDHKQGRPKYGAERLKQQRLYIYLSRQE